MRVWRRGPAGSDNPERRLRQERMVNRSRGFGSYLERLPSCPRLQFLKVPPAQMLNLCSRGRSTHYFGARKSADSPAGKKPPIVHGTGARGIGRLSLAASKSVRLASRAARCLAMRCKGGDRSPHGLDMQSRWKSSKQQQFRLCDASHKAVKLATPLRPRNVTYASQYRHFSWRTGN
jgi:hypothetical protein